MYTIQTMMLRYMYLRHPAYNTMWLIPYEAPMWLTPGLVNIPLWLTLCPVSAWFLVLCPIGQDCPCCPVRLDSQRAASSLKKLLTGVYKTFRRSRTLSVALGLCRSGSFSIICTKTYRNKSNSQQTMYLYIR